VFVPDSDKVPEPDLVSVPVLVAIDPEIVAVPSASMVKPNAPVKPPLKVNELDESACTSDAAAKVIAPDQVLAPEAFRITPFVDTPVPEIVIGSVTPLSPPDTVMAASLDTVVEERETPLSPSAALFEIETTPALTVVVPVKVLAASRDNVPLPYLVTPPEVVAIGSWMITSPLPAKFRPKSPVNAFPVETLNVSDPSSDWIRDVAASVTSPVMVLRSVSAVERLRIEPFVPTPFPVMLNASEMLMAVPLR
jgi:hypothetical protein